MVEVRDVDAMIDAIGRLVVRGAPAIGVAGAFGVAIAAQQAEREGLGPEHVRREAERIAAARPTAVNLAWAVRRVLARLDEGTAAVVAEAVAMADEDVETNRRLAAVAPTCWRSSAWCRHVSTRTATPAGSPRWSGGRLWELCAS